MGGRVEDVWLGGYRYREYGCVVDDGFFFLMAVVTINTILRASPRPSDGVGMKDSFKPSTMSLKLGERRWMDRD